LIRCTYPRASAALTHPLTRCGSARSGGTLSNFNRSSRVFADGVVLPAASASHTLSV
jgi:hypothetical protein